MNGPEKQDNTDHGIQCVWCHHPDEVSDRLNVPLFLQEPIFFAHHLEGMKNNEVEGEPDDQWHGLETKEDSPHHGQFQKDCPQFQITQVNGDEQEHKSYYRGSQENGAHAFGIMERSENVEFRALAHDGTDVHDVQMHESGQQGNAPDQVKKLVEGTLAREVVREL